MSSTTLPSVLIEKILWDLPTKELVRTSILSKEWRYFWTKFPKAAFREELLDDEYHRLSNLEKTLRRNKFFNAIYQFLLLHQGPIVDFTLSMISSERTEIDQILLHLSRKNTVKKLHLTSTCELPLSIFSFHQLTDLYLSCSSIYKTPTTFNGFGSLTTLCLEYVFIYRKALMHILSHNPLLKSFSMITRSGQMWVRNEDEEATIIDLFKYLPVIEHLTFCVWDIQYFGKGAVPQALAAPLVHLKCLRLERMFLLEEDWLRFLVLMIRSSPNLEKLKLQIFGDDHDEFDTLTMQDYSDIRLKHLIELEIENFNTNPNLEFVKLILAKSPVLKTVRLKVYGIDEELKQLRSLEHAPHASPMVEIIGDYGGGQ